MNKPKSRNQITSNEGIDDLEFLTHELAKNVPNRQKIKELTEKYGIVCSHGPNLLISDLICFLDNQKIDKEHQ